MVEREGQREGQIGWEGLELGQDWKTVCYQIEYQ